MRKRAIRFINLLVFMLLTLSAGTVLGQVAVSASADSPIHFANMADFSAGSLTINFNMPVGKTTAEVEVTLATGIEYIDNSLTIMGGTASSKAGSTATKPVFTITAIGGAPITLVIKRKVTKAAMNKLQNGDNFFDSVKLSVIGGGTATALSNQYDLPIPVFTVQVASKHDNALGTSSQTFNILNGGDGRVKEVYFSIAYPTDVISNKVEYNGAVLPQIGTVPAGLPNAGEPLYKATVSAGLGNQQSITITENYTVSKCDPNRQIKYAAYWGSDKDKLFTSATNTKVINTNVGTPSIELDTDNQNTYFEWHDGLCGSKIGTYYVTYENKGSQNGTAYNLSAILYEMQRWARNREYRPANVNIIDSNGNKIPVPLSAPNINKAYNVNFGNLPALQVTALVGKNIGLTDEDRDGYADDMKVGAKLKICFDWVKDKGISCLQKEAFSVQPVTQFQYDDVCKGNNVRNTSAAQQVHENTFHRYYDNISDGSRLPIQLVKNVRMAGYFYAAINYYSSSATERLKGGNKMENDHRFRYHIELPAGVALKNVKFYGNDIYGAATSGQTISLNDVPAGGVLNYTTDRKSRGYIGYEMVLENCQGSDATIKYTLYYLDRVGNTNSFCEIPVVCESKTISTICSGSCSDNGPVMNRTYVERADNSYGWTDHNMTTRVQRTAVPEVDRQRALYLDDIEVFAEGTQANIIANNLYYYASVTKETILEPKSIKVTMAGNTNVLSATTAGVVTKATDANGNYFRWNLTSVLPSGKLTAGQTFSVVATYQVKSGDVSTDGTTRQAGAASFFYTLADKNDTAINAAQALHTNARMCGSKLIPTFYIGETRGLLATNEYKLRGCDEETIGSNLIYSSRRFNTDGTYFTKEFRPGRLIKKIIIKMPLAYRITQPVPYDRTIAVGPVRTSYAIPLSDFQITEEGNFRVYTYVNPAPGQPGYLAPAIIMVRNEYSEYIRPKIQASCKAREWQTFGRDDVRTINEGEKIDSYIEFEDFYYHYYGKTEKEVVTDKLIDRPIHYMDKPKITIQSGALSIKAVQREQQLEFQLKAGLIAAPNAWVSIPNAVGINIIKLEELSGAGGTVVNTYTPQASLTNESMFFLNQTIKNERKYFRLIYDVTNCSLSKLPFELHAGWNCSGNPTEGYQSTCSDDKKVYEISVAKTYKQIAPAPTNPGQNVCHYSL